MSCFYMQYSLSGYCDITAGTQHSSSAVINSHASTPLHPDVRLKKLPFYKALNTLLKPSSLCKQPALSNSGCLIVLDVSLSRMAVCSLLSVLLTYCLYTDAGRLYSVFVRSEQSSQRNICKCQTLHVIIDVFLVPLIVWCLTFIQTLILLDHVY